MEQKHRVYHRTLAGDRLDDLCLLMTERRDNDFIVECEMKRDRANRLDAAIASSFVQAQHHRDQLIESDGEQNVARLIEFPVRWASKATHDGGQATH